MKKFFVVVLLSIFWITNCYAVVIIKGPGNLSCGTWTKDQNDRHSRNFYMSWVLGFLSGHAYALNESVLKGIDINAIEGEINKYCAENPINDIADASIETYIKIQRKKGQ